MDNFMGGGGVGGGGGLMQPFLDLPPITRAQIGATLVVTAGVNVNYLKLSDMAFFWESAVWSGEIWRFLTCFLYAGSFSFQTLIGLHLLVQNSSRYESMGSIDTGGGGTSSDYAYALLLGMVGTMVTYQALLQWAPASVLRGLSPLFYRQLTHFVLYVWSKQRARHRVNLLGMSMDAAYLPYAYMGMAFFLNDGRVPVNMIHGMFVGHVYYYLAAIVPAVIGKSVLRTPRLLIELFEPRGMDDNPIIVDVDGVIGG